jgi:hypothetical protein
MDYTDFRKRCQVVRSNPWDDFTTTTSIVYGCTAKEYKWAHRYEVDLVEARDVETFEGGKGKTRKPGIYETPQKFFFTKTLGKEPIQGAARSNTFPAWYGEGSEVSAQRSEFTERRSDDGDRDSEDSKVTYSANNYPL